MTTEKVIFLDIDGPLMPGKQWFVPQNSNIRKTLGNNWWKQMTDSDKLDELVTFDPAAVSFFNIWQRMSGAKIVMATNWRRWMSRERLEAIFDRNGLDADIHDDWETGYRFTSNRMNEIGMWMDDHKNATGIIVDDDPDLCRYSDWFNETDKQDKLDADAWQRKLKLVEVDYSNGLTLSNFNFACKSLDIDIEDVGEEIFGVKKLTAEEKKQRQIDLDMLIRCAI